MPPAKRRGSPSRPAPRPVPFGTRTLLVAARLGLRPVCVLIPIRRAGFRTLALLASRLFAGPAAPKPLEHSGKPVVDAALRDRHGGGCDAQPPDTDDDMRARSRRVYNQGACTIKMGVRSRCAYDQRTRRSPPASGAHHQPCTPTAPARDVLSVPGLRTTPAPSPQRQPPHPPASLRARCPVRGPPAWVHPRPESRP